jgi:hypothetical protein
LRLSLPFDQLLSGERKGKEACWSTLSNSEAHAPRPMTIETL